MDRFQYQKPLSAGELEQELIAWEQAAVSVADIRRHRLSPGQEIRDYAAPAGLFLYLCGDGGQVQLDDAPYRVERFGLFHGNKGTRFSIIPAQSSLEYYLVMYRARDASLSPLRRKQHLRQQDAEQLMGQLGFCPGNPIWFAEQLHRMHSYWHTAAPLQKFFVKGAFYQLVYEIYRELEREDGQMLQPDLAAQAVQYIERYYSDGITVQSLTELLQISPRHLNRLVRQKTGKSPLDYMQAVRLEAVAKYLLKYDNVTLREIAQAVGFYDEYHLSRSFKKYYGTTPQAYRRNYTSRLSDEYIGSLQDFPYSDERKINFIKHGDRREESMLGQMKKKMIIAAALAMLVSACGGGGTGTEGSGGANSPSPKASVQSTASPETATRTVETDFGPVQVPANPQRIVVNFVQGDLLALGIKPVGTGMKEGAVFEHQLLDVQLLDGWSANVEEIMALEPDLIIWSGDQEVYDKLSKIAPTIIKDFPDPLARLAFLGQAVGRGEEAQQLIDQFNSRVEEGKARLAEKELLDKTVILLEEQGRGGTLRAFGNNFGRGGELIYTFLGIQAPQRITDEVIDAGKFNIDLSMEVLKDYAGDYIFVNEHTAAAMKGNAVWEALPAVREGRLIVNDAQMFWFQDILSMNAQLEFILESLIASAE